MEHGRQSLSTPVILFIAITPVNTGGFIDSTLWGMRRRNVTVKL